MCYPAGEPLGEGHGQGVGGENYWNVEAWCLECFANKFYVPE